MQKYQWEKEESEILDAIEEGEWEMVKPKKAELGHYAEIAKVREEQGLSQRQLADRLHTTQQTVSRLENHTTAAFL